MVRREISRLNILVAAAGGMVGSGWLFSPFISAQIAGPYALISWVIATVFILFIALPLCELGAMFPISGGMTNYPGFTHGPTIGFLFAWTSWLSYVVMTPIEVQAILQYSSHFFPSMVAQPKSETLTLSSLGYGVAFCIMLGVVLMNTFGVRRLAQYNKFASIIKFIVPSLAIVSLLYVSPSIVSLHHFKDIGHAAAWHNIFTALSTGGIIFAFTGFQNGLMLAGEVENPQRNLPIAILGAVLIGFVLYFLLQLSFLSAVPAQYVKNGWHTLHFPDDSGPLVGLTLLTGLTFVASLLIFDAAFSPFGTALIYTAATSRIVYGMAINGYLPKSLTRVNRYGIPALTLYINLMVGLFSFLPFPGWQKMMTFLSSCSILSYSIGPICLLALRKLAPTQRRPFKLPYAAFLSHLAFYVCNLMLYWCGFDILWKLDMALAIGWLFSYFYQPNQEKMSSNTIYWFVGYIATLTILAWLNQTTLLPRLFFPLDLIIMLPISIFFLSWSERSVVGQNDHHALMKEALAEMPVH